MVRRRSPWRGTSHPARLPPPPHPTPRFLSFCLSNRLSVVSLSLSVRWLVRGAGAGYTSWAMDVSLFDYELPAELIAQEPAEPRDASRLLVLDRGRSTWEDRVFGDLAGLLRPGDCLVANRSRVIPARLLGVSEA